MNRDFDAQARHMRFLRRKFVSDYAPEKAKDRDEFHCRLDELLRENAKDHMRVVVYEPDPPRYEYRLEAKDG